MFKWIITFIFTNVLVTIDAPPRPQPAPPQPIYLHKWDIPNTQLRDIYLPRINSEEVLPIVLFQIREIVHSLDVPDDIYNVAIWEGKIVKGTTFIKKGSRRPLFFCSKLVQNEDTQEEGWCLAPQDFEDLQQLRCSEQPVPTEIHSGYPICGIESENTRISLAMAYEFCEPEKYNYVSKSALSIYDFCFDWERKKTLYTGHSIRSPKLLESPLLYRERQMVYDYSHVDRLPTANQDMIQHLLNQQSSSDPPLYRVQQLVPEEDMALANWRKTTRRFLNAELQLSVLFDIWNDINSALRAEAIQVFDDNKGFYVSTGVFDNGYDLPESTDGQMYNKWVKMIILKSTSSYYSVELAGVVILMNNFLNFHTNDDALQSVQNELARLCPYDSCAFSNFKIRVDNVGGQMRCCMINPHIAQLFNLQIRPDLPLLNIPGLTVPPI